MPNFDQERTGHGTQEWAEINANIQQGCSNDCLYCYARANALRFGKIKSRDEWRDEKINQQAVDRPWQKRRGVVMFPTAHDINRNNIRECTRFLLHVLDPGNKVLIVSKPSRVCIDYLCEALKRFRDQILFRFTIGVTDPEVSRFWEPGAPLPDERIAALKFAQRSGYQTSVSMEPMLGGPRMVIDTFKAVEPYVTETVWIGKMNKMRQRIEPTSKNLQAVSDIEYLQRDSALLRLVDALDGESKIRWKDSIKTVIKKYSQGETP